MRYFLLSLFVYVWMPVLHAQIAAVDVDKGSVNQKVTDIIIVFKMHFDIGYTDWSEGILQKYKGEMLQETLKQIDKTYQLPKQEQFVWTVPAWPLKYIRENCDEKYRKSFDKAMKNGRITPHALPLTYETEASDMETLVRGLTYSDNLRKEFGRKPARAAKLTDVPSHSYILPTILKNAGVEFLHIGCNPGSISPELPVLSFWEGPDKSRILLMNWAEYYGSGVLPPANWPYKTWLAMIHTHENSGAPTAEEVAVVLKEAKEKMPHARVRIGELDDFYDSLMKENPELPIVKGDLPDTWIHGYSSMPNATRIARNLHRTTYATESLENLLGLWGITEDTHTNDFNHAIENQILYDEHTFGIAMTHAGQQDWSYGDKFQRNKAMGYYDYAETSWDEKGSRIQTAERIVMPIMRTHLASLAKQLPVDGKKLVVYNPDPWMRSGRVEFFLGVYGKNFTIYGLRDLVSGKVIPAYNDANLLSFDAENVPPMGYKAYQVLTEPMKTEVATTIDKQRYIIENQYYRLEVNPKTGALCSLYDKLVKKECVDTSSPYGFGQFVHEFYGNEDIDHYNKVYVKKGAEGWAYQEMGRPYTTHEKRIVTKGKVEKIECESMNNGARIHVFGVTDDEIPLRYIMTYSLYDKQYYVDINFGMNSKPVDARPEGGWLAFPFNVKNPEYRAHRLGGILNPKADFVNFTNQRYFYLNSSIALFDKDMSGFALDTPEAPGISLDATGLFDFGRSFVPQTGLVFANLYNTQWGTNFTEWVDRGFHLRYRIRSFAKYDPALSLAVPSEEVRLPLMASYADTPKGKIPVYMAGFSLDKKGVYLTSARKTEKGWIVRIWDQSGKSDKVKLTLPADLKVRKAEELDLRDRSLGKPACMVYQNQVELMIEANRPVTLLLTE